ncbi:ribonuclease H-like domain-containing protein [Rhizophagus irregularis DAOM 181602=DAOM 197198]|uniref:Ribonuclease H-like domain-containing protein n=1 Tax=Rhizophagus irregularis (strain DAOM 181602 / DAOM 197198 / MUCL 43194) TaxID=747089 RepID=A0A2P4P3W1_RHIID|nr:ribonuclease H-like domain-containing protein [Rhizophagus irregularis DAOM 181602=DAOM 197198]POG60069.1 ribonuclease H-like domain-containing protein [Rhizophagus irregularis DAOM 181602=DAOM 197198]|eukprot:XP_025166935.1 ribonuclease H-like domain-containing protein [Rhizophagus irregularis DAOM 181602=DAOM 197198]
MDRLFLQGFYTDGSLSRDDDIPIMGFGWIFTSDLSMNIKYSGSCKEWASSTKAELVAIITALIVCPPHSTINIYTDSNNCINTFNDLHSPKLTARLSLIKVKAHSDNPLNDAADILAKEGRSSINFIQFNIQHIKTQTCHLTFNNTTTVDHWEYSQLWFKYNSFSKPTSKQYTKHISWRVKCSSHNLPTLDILNRNYPELLQNYETCILCSTYI